MCLCERGNKNVIKQEENEHQAFPRQKMDCLRQLKMASSNNGDVTTCVVLRKEREREREREMAKQIKKITELFTLRFKKKKPTAVQEVLNVNEIDDFTEVCLFV